MSDIFVEVDEALKQEKLENLWNKYGGLVIGAIIAIILGTAANAGYGAWKINHDTKQTDIFLTIENMEDPSPEEYLQITQSVDGGLKTITKIRAASAALENKDFAQAHKIFTEISQSDAENPEFRALATYMKAQTQQDISVEDKLATLQNIAQDDKNPWKYFAALDAALIMGEENNNFKEARALLKTINDDEKAPKTLRQKAQSIDILYALKENE